MARPANRSPQTRLVLEALEAGRWCHGYELAQATGLKSGTLYPILARLARQGLLESRWEERRHLYRLTGAGAALARERRAAVGGAVCPA